MPLDQVSENFFLRGERNMSWLKKIVCKISMQGTEQAAKEVLDAMPTAQCLTVEPASANTAGEENKNPAAPRRYFIKADLLSGAIVPPSVTAEPWPSELSRRTRIRHNSTVTL
jgi:hypothetical protein